MSQSSLPFYNPDIPTPLLVVFPVPVGADDFHLISTDGSLDIVLPDPIEPTPTVTANGPIDQVVPPFTLDPPRMMGRLGDFWEIQVGGDTFFWAAVGLGWIAAPSPRWVAPPCAPATADRLAIRMIHRQHPEGAERRNTDTQEGLVGCLRRTLDN